MQMPHSEVRFPLIAAATAGIWFALLLGFDQGTASALLAMAALASAQAGLTFGSPGFVPVPLTVEGLFLAPPPGADALPDVGVFGFDLDLSF
jgi:hypothetical protein